MKKILTLIGILLVIGGLIGLGQPQKVVYNSYMSGGIWEQHDKTVVKSFMDRYPDIEVEHSIVAHEDFKNLIRVWLNSNKPPDVMTWFAGNRLRYFVDKGLVADISDVWEEYNLENVFPKGIREACKDNGKYYFVPLSEDIWAIFYRKDIFEKLDLEIPKTWDEFVQVCKTLKEAGYTPISIGTRYKWTAAAWFDYLNLRINGPDFHNKLMAGEVPYDSPKVKEVFSYWKEVLPYFLDNHTSYTGDQSTEFLIRGDAAMILQGNWILESYPDEREESELGFFRFPIIDPEVPLAEEVPIDGYIMAANAPNKHSAKKLLAFMASKKAQAITSEYDVVPRPDIDYPETTTGKITQQLVEKIVNPAEYVTQFYDRDTTPPMAEEGMNGFVKFMLKPEKLDEILAQLEKSRKDILGS